MTEEQERPAGNCDRHFNAKAAAIRTDYSKVNITRASKRFMEDLEVSGAIEQKSNAAVACDKVMDESDALEHLTNSARGEELQTKGRTSALWLMGQCRGVSVERNEFTKRSDSFSMADDQLNAEMYDLKQKRLPCNGVRLGRTPIRPRGFSQGSPSWTERAASCLPELVEYREAESEMGDKP